MEFWGVEVKPGETVNIEPDDDRFLHLSQASLGKLKGNENAVIFVKVNGQKLVLGTLSSEKCPQIPFDLVFDKEFELWHTSKNTSISFAGYKAPMDGEESDSEDYPESECEPEPEKVAVGQSANGKTVIKQDQGKPGAGKANSGKEDNSAARKAKKVEPMKVDKPAVEDDDDEDEDDEDDDDGKDDGDEDGESEDDEDVAEAMSDSDDEDEDDSSSEEDVATPKKAETRKRPATDSASKTPVPQKKAKVLTPADQKTGGDGKKHVHVATPHPAKQAGKKTPGNNDKSKQQTPKSSGSVVCRSCSRTFNSDSALQAHAKAKHG